MASSEIRDRAPRLTRCLDALTRAASALCLAILVPFTFWALAESPSARPASANGSGMAAGNSAGTPISLPSGVQEATEAPRTKTSPAQISGGDRLATQVADCLLPHDLSRVGHAAPLDVLSVATADLLSFRSRAPPARA